MPAELDGQTNSGANDDVVMDREFVNPLLIVCPTFHACGCRRSAVTTIAYALLQLQLQHTNTNIFYSINMSNRSSSSAFRNY